MKKIALLVLLCSSLVSACASSSGGRIPNIKDGSSIDVFSDQLVSIADGEKVNLWKKNSEGAYVLRLPGYGNNRIVKAMHERFDELCKLNNGETYTDFSNANSPVAMYSEKELVNVYGVSRDDINKFGSKVMYVSSYSISDYNKPSFIEMNVSNIPAFFTQSSLVHTMNGFEGFAPRKPYWDKLSGFCAKKHRDNGSLHFSWLFITNQMNYDGAGDLFVAIRNEESLRNMEKAIVKNFYSAKKKEVMANSRYEESVRMAEKKKEIETQRMRALKAERASREKALAEEKARLEIARNKRAAAFRKKIEEGNESHCGLIVEVKEKVVLVQTMIGQTWIKRNDLFPRNEAECRFVNGKYVSP